MSTFMNTDPKAFSGVWVFCEQRQGKMMPTTFELISEGRKLADELGVQLSGILLGDSVDNIAAELGEPVNSISFHVRSLANVGILVEVPELAKDARERVWLLGPPTINADLDLLKDDAAYRTSASASIGLIYSEVERAITAAMAAGPETLAHSEATSLRLTRHQARALALVLGGEEGVKNLVDELLGHAGAIVVDDE